MFLCGVAALLALIPLAQANPQAPKLPDRSGEPALRALMEEYSKLKNVRASVSWTSREKASGPYYAERTLEFLYSKPTVFRVATTGMWGDGVTFVSDGKSILRDSLDEDAGLSLHDVQPNVFDCHSDLALRGQASTVLFYLFAGPKALDSLVAKDGFIKKAATKGELDTIQFKSSMIGVVTLLVDARGRQKLVRRIEFDNLEFREEQARLYPEWVDMPEDPLDVQEIRYVSVGRRLDRKLFVSEYKGKLSVQDLRTKRRP